MKQKIFTFLFALLASVGTIFAVTIEGISNHLNETESTAQVTVEDELVPIIEELGNRESVQIGDLYYFLNTNDKTAEVTSQNREYPYWSTNITVANIPSSVEYNSVTYSVTRIGYEAFYSCTSLTSITIPNSITYIDSYAFYGCTNLPIENNLRYADTYLVEAVDHSLSTYTIKEGTRWIGNDAFRGCTNLTSITMPNSVTYIESYAFYGCSGLTSVTIPNSVTYIGYNAFSRCIGLKSIEIPGSITYIESGTFSGCTGLTSVTIGDGVVWIGNGAFKNCTNLASITIPNSVTEIESDAFKGCSSLPVENNLRYVGLYLVEAVDKTASSYTLKEGTKWIGSEAFKNCTNLTSITIPNSVTEIGINAFEGCSSLTSITIPDGVSQIESSVFSGCTGLTSVAIPNSVTYIGYYAFSGCTGLKYIEIPNSVKWIVDYAFSGCSGLTSIEIPTSVKRIAEYAFSGCSGLTSVTIPNSVTSIGQGTFYGCTSLKYIEIPNSVTYIGVYAFGGCAVLASIEIPNSVTYIEGGAFGGCSNLTSVIWNAPKCCDFASDNTPFYRNRSYSSENFPDTRSQITSFIFGDQVEHIPAYLCEGINQLTSIEIPNSVTSIGEHAFDLCTGLTSAKISSNVEDCDWRIAGSALEKISAPAWFFDVQEPDWSTCPKYLKTVAVNAGELNDNVLGIITRSYKTITSLDLSGVTNTTLPDEAVKNFYNMTELKLPRNAEYIGYMSVAECVKLQEINIPSSVVEIEDRAFENCRSLKTITFGDAVSSAPARFNARTASNSQLQRIGNWAFYNCHELQNLEIPEGVTEIGDGAFYGCTYMESLSLPASVRAIGDNTFALCSKMKRIVVNAANPPSIQTKTFYDVQREIPVYVPDESVDTYKNDASWKEFNIQGRSNMHEAIDQIRDNLPVTNKVLVNGQILILRGDKTYTLQGQEIK